MAAVFVAGKVEECIRRARDVVNVFHHLYCLVRGLPAQPIDYVGDTYYIWRDRLCTTEAVLLRTLGFHVQPSSPVPLLISYLKVLELPQLLPQLPQTAFCWLNDLLRSPAGVLFQPNVLAVCAIDLAATDLAFTFPKEDLIAEWFALFDVAGEELRGCRGVVLEAMQGAGEIDFLLPLTREELKIFSSQVTESDREDGTIADEKDQDQRHKDHCHIRSVSKRSDDRTNTSRASSGNRSTDPHNRRPSFNDPKRSRKSSQVEPHSHSRSRSRSPSRSRYYTNKK